MSQERKTLPEVENAPTLKLVTDSESSLEEKQEIRAQLDRFAVSREPEYRQSARAQLRRDWTAIAQVAQRQLREQSSAPDTTETKQIDEDSADDLEERLAVLAAVLIGRWLGRFRVINRRTAAVVIASLNADLESSISAANPNIQSAIEERTRFLAENVTNLNVQATMEIVRRGIEEGWSRARVIDEIRRVHTGGFAGTNEDGDRMRVLATRKRAQLIARTESSAIVNIAAGHAALESDEDLRKARITQGDARVRDSHRAEAETVIGFIPLEEPYPVTGNMWAGTDVNCFSDDTEVLTSRGWLRFEELNGDEEIFSLNTETHEVYWQSYVREIYKRYQGNMLHFHGRSVDMLVTPNHQMYRGREVETENGWEQQDELEDAQRLADRANYTIFQSGRWSGEDPEFILGGKKVSPELYARFMAYFLSEGSLIYNETRNMISITQGDGGFDKLYNEIKSLPFKVNVTRDTATDTNKLSIYDPNLAEDLKDFGHSHEKYIPDNIKNASAETIRHFLDAYCHGDGHIREPKEVNINPGGNYSRERRYFFSNSPQIQADIGELLLKTEKSVSYRTYTHANVPVQHRNGEYSANYDVVGIHENHSQRIWQKGYRDRVKVDKVPYDGYVYDVELPKDHVLLVRRNGTVLWSGNCRCFNAFEQVE